MSVLRLSDSESQLISKFFCSMTKKRGGVGTVSEGLASPFDFFAHNGI